MSQFIYRILAQLIEWRGGVRPASAFCLSDEYSLFFDSNGYQDVSTLMDMNAIKI